MKHGLILTGVAALALLIGGDLAFGGPFFPLPKKPTLPKTPAWVPQVPAYKPNGGTTIGSAPVPNTAPARQPLKKPEVHRPTQTFTARGNQVYESKSGAKAYVAPSNNGVRPNHVLKSPNGTQIFKPQGTTAQGTRVYESQNGSTMNIRPKAAAPAPQPTARGSNTARAREGIELYNKVYGAKKP